MQVSWMGSSEATVYGFQGLKMDIYGLNLDRIYIFFTDNDVYQFLIMVSK